jgi:hypothetical protein
LNETQNKITKLTIDFTSKSKLLINFDNYPTTFLKFMNITTGTDTGVGKTYISSIIGKHLKYKENKNISKNK